METLGILLLTAGTWVTYCGVTGLHPWQLALKITADPKHASQLIADARKAEADLMAKLAPDKPVVTGSKLNPSVNPYALLPVSDGFGARGGEHKGIDYIMPSGTPIICAGSGVLHNAPGNPASDHPGTGSGGNIITVSLPNGYSMLYMHVSRFRPELNGKSVKYGQIIGYSGGNAGAPGAGDSTGAHLHFQVNDPNGNPIDPKTYFSGKAPVILKGTALA